MSGRMSASTRYKQNPDGSFSRALGGSDGAYDEMTKAELEAELDARGLAKTGKKAELIARLEEDDAA